MSFVTENHNDEILNSTHFAVWSVIKCDTLFLDTVQEVQWGQRSFQPNIVYNQAKCLFSHSLQKGHSHLLPRVSWAWLSLKNSASAQICEEPLIFPALPCGLTGYCKEYTHSLYNAHMFLVYLSEGGNTTFSMASFISLNLDVCSFLHLRWVPHLPLQSVEKQKFLGHESLYLNTDTWSKSD